MSRGLFTFRVTPTEKRRYISEPAKRKGLSRSDYIRDAIGLPMLGAHATKTGREISELAPSDVDRASQPGLAALADVAQLLNERNSDDKTTDDERGPAPP